MDVIQTIKKHKIIVIARNVNPDRILDAARAMLDGNIHLLEVTFDQKNPRVNSETAKKIRLLREHFEGQLLIGAGTVLTPEQARVAVEAGAQYIISPNFNPEVVRETKRLGAISIPGAFTPTEIMAAYECGAHFIKLFPAAENGANYAKAILSPLSHIPMIATGGVSDVNMLQFLEMGFAGVGIGSNLMNNRLIEAGDFEGLKRLALRYTALLPE
jgi:2-dehydro-3-deoxyphosphogluconate aldolase / (4S)-4-hydroxy-2-oxoglutarate aldolase